MASLSLTGLRNNLQHTPVARQALLYFRTLRRHLYRQKDKKEVKDMASYIPTESRINLRVQTGTDTDGSPILRTMGIRDIDPAAAPESAAAVVQALGGLLAYPIVEAVKIDNNEIDTAA